jgi:predicted  nucleic acid-binding Zn-ribbon protein
MSINLAADTAKSEITVEEKLKALYKLQSIDTKIDKIRIVRGELPLEVQDLEDELIGLETRITNLNNETSDLEQKISDKKNAIKEAQALIKKYEEQQNNVRNNREFDSLNKEIEYQTLDIQLSEKNIREFTAKIELKNEQIAQFQTVLDERRKDLEQKKAELDDIVAETQKEEEQLNNASQKAGDKIEDRLLTAYKRIRENAANGLAVVTIERDACGGCFNKIPPQRQMDIRLRKKIIVCEYCGRILVDPEIPQETE